MGLLDVLLFVVDSFVIWVWWVCSDCLLLVLRVVESLFVIWWLAAWVRWLVGLRAFGLGLAVAPGFVVLRVLFGYWLLGLVCFVWCWMVAGV